MRKKFFYEINILDFVKAVFSGIGNKTKNPVVYFKKGSLLKLGIFSFLTNRYIKKYEPVKGISTEKGLYLKIHKICYQLTESYFEQNNFSNNIVNRLCKKKFRTDKFDNYFKLCIADEIIDFLTCAWLFYINEDTENHIIVKKNNLLLFVVKYLKEREMVVNISWLKTKNKLYNVLSTMILYYLRLIFFVCKRGFCLNREKKRYLISKEAAQGVCGEIKFNSDDFFIDDNYIKKNKVIFYYTGTQHKSRKKAYRQIKDKGYSCVDITKLKFDIKSLGLLLEYYIFYPLHVFFCVIIFNNDFLVSSFVYFIIQAIQLEPFLSLYSIKANITINDAGSFQVIETIIFNKYGTHNILYHWSDLATYMNVLHQYKAVNTYLIWGDNTLRHCGNNFEVDEIIKIGFQGRSFYSKAVEDKDIIKSRLKRNNSKYPIVSFFDTSFDKNFIYSEESIIDFLKLIENFSKKQKSNILLKTKYIHDYEDVLNEDIKRLFKSFSKIENINILDNYQWDVLEVIAISDVCVSLGMSSPSTIAIILNKPALYYNNVDNSPHPFYNKYKNKVVFEDEEKLFSKIDDLTKNKYLFKELISKDDIKLYDEFQDGHEFERFCKTIHQKCLEPGCK